MILANYMVIKAYQDAVQQNKTGEFWIAWIICIAVMLLMVGFMMKGKE